MKLTCFCENRIVGEKKKKSNTRIVVLGDFRKHPADEDSQQSRDRGRERPAAVMLSSYGKTLF